MPSIYFSITMAMKKRQQVKQYLRLCCFTNLPETSSQHDLSYDLLWIRTNQNTFLHAGRIFFHHRVVFFKCTIFLLTSSQFRWGDLMYDKMQNSSGGNIWGKSETRNLVLSSLLKRNEENYIFFLSFFVHNL